MDMEKTVKYKFELGIVFLLFSAFKQTDLRLCPSRNLSISYLVQYIHMIHIADANISNSISLNRCNLIITTLIIACEIKNGPPVPETVALNA